MDFSKKYIKMCEKAEEIQKEWLNRLPHPADFVWWAKKGVICTFIESGEGYKVWLPRQDQLQEMVRDRWGSWTGLLEEFGEYVKSKRWLDDTPEMYWLAFVMKELYNKIWDEEKEEWVKMKGGERYA